MTALALVRAVGAIDLDRPALLRHAARRSPWKALLAASVTSAIPLALVTMSSDASPLPFLRMSVIALAAAATLAVDDSAIILTSTLPAGTLRQRYRTLGLAGAGALLATAGLIALAQSLAGGALVRPSGIGLALELAGLVTVGWALATVLTDRRGLAAAGRLSACAMAAATLVSAAVPATADVLWSAPGRVSNVGAWSVITALALACTWWTSSELRLASIGRRAE
jgi:hypothetical protein